MSKRGWIITSIVVGAAVGLIGTAAGFGAYIHRARRAASESARETFDPYYSLMQYMLTEKDSDSRDDRA